MQGRGGGADLCSRQRQQEACQPEEERGLVSSGNREEGQGSWCELAEGESSHIYDTYACYSELPMGSPGYGGAAERAHAQAAFTVKFGGCCWRRE